jgi:spermidine/putrescine ABC transporter ATP-binding subunit
MVDVSLENISIAYNHPHRGPVVAVRDVSLRIRSGELLTLLGPSGCGKTTTLRMVAGFQAASSGTLLIDRQDVTAIPANKRDIGFVFQNYALFPHLTVAENVAYGLRVRRHAKNAIAEEVQRVLGLVALADYGARLPQELSGGQQQRVALARAIVIRPRVLLFDEPLSNLDARLRVQMRDEIRDLQRTLGITTLYVTHDQEEAMAISDRIAVMDQGCVAQCDTPEALYRSPTSAFVASFLGRANLLDAIVIGYDGTNVILDIEQQQLSIAAPHALSSGTAVRVLIRPEAIGLAVPGTADGLDATVTARTYLGEKTEYVVRIAGQSVQVVRFNPPEDEHFAPGSPVTIRLPSHGMQLLA